LLSAGAEQEWAALHDCIFGVNKVWDALINAAGRLSKFSERGSYLKELVGLGMKESRQVFFKPYLVTDRVTDSPVFIDLIVD
jgi:toxin ParE1/3/4